MGIAAEKQVYDAILADENLKARYKNRIFQGFVAPDSLASVPSYIYVTRISDTALDRNLDMLGDTLRRVRLQVDVCDVSYAEMAVRSREVRDVLRRNFPSCIEGSSKGMFNSGQTVWNVTSIDVILFEEEYERECD